MTNIVATLSIVLVLFLFIDERKLKTKEQIEKRLNKQEIEEYTKKIKDIQNNISVKEVENIEYMEDILKNVTSEYVFLLEKELNLSDNIKEQIIYNYILGNQAICFLKGKYSSRKVKKKTFLNLKNGILIDILNYINLFYKDKIDNYCIIIGKVSDITKYIKKYKVKNNRYSCTEEVYIYLKSSKEVFLKYKESIKNINIKTVVKIGIFIFSTGSITWNFVRSVIMIENDVYLFLIATAIYYCYTKVVGYMYKTIGKMKYITRYIFPIYLVIYIFTYLYFSIWGIKKT